MTNDDNFTVTPTHYEDHVFYSTLPLNAEEFLGLYGHMKKRFWITYKAGSGRTIAYCQGFPTRAAAQAKIDANGWDTMHVVED